MAGSTLYTLLVKLGFDITTLKSGSKDAQVELAAIGKAAQLAAANGSPAAAALANIAKAANQVQGSAGATAVLRNMAGAANDVLIATRGSANALNSFAATAQKVSSATQNGTVLNNYAKAVTAISDKTRGSVSAITDFNKGVQRTLIETNGSVAGLNRYMTATVAAAQGSSTAAEAVKAVGMAARGGAPSLAQAAGAAGAAGAETANLGNAAATATPKVAGTGKAAQAAANGMNQMTGAAMRTTTAVKEAGEAAVVANDRAGFLNRTLSMAFAFGGGVAVTTAIGFIGNAILGFNSRLQQAHIAFETLLGTSGDADKFIKQMEQFANVTPFDFQGVQDATQRLMAMGFTAEQVLPTLRAVGDTVAGLGGGTDKLDRVTIALGQMMTAGRVNAQDMRQLTEAGIPAWQMLADSIHKTVGETRDLAQKGLIPSAEAIPAILKGMNEQFGGLMAKQARTAQGAFSTIRDAALQTMSGAVKPLFDMLTTGLVALGDFFIAGGGRLLVPFIQSVGIAIAVFLIPRLIGMANTLLALRVEIAGLTVHLLPMIAVITLLGLAWQENFGNIRNALGPVLKGIGDFAGAIANAAASSGLLFPILEALVVLLGVRWVAALAMSAAGMLANTVMALMMGGAMAGLAAESAAAGAAIGGGGLIGALGGLVALLGGPVLVTIGLVAGAFILLQVNGYDAAQGVRVVAYTFQGAVASILEATSWLPFVGDKFKDLASGLRESQAAIQREAQAALDERNRAAARTPDISALSDPDAFQKLLDSFKNGSAAIGQETVKLVDQFGTSMAGVVEAARNAGGDAMAEMAKAIADKRAAPVAALQTLHDMLRTAMTPTTEIARLMGELTSTELAAGLVSGDPVVRAQMEATKKMIIDRLNEITDGAYSAGTDAATAYAKAWADVQSNNTLAGMGNALNQTVEGRVAAQRAAWEAVKPSQAAVLEQQKQLNAELSKTAMSEGLSALNSAFSDIQQSAHRYFDQMHQDNLKLIDDAVKQKNAILDAKAALNQAPVTAAQRALDFQRRQIQEWRLRQGVAHATDPAAYRDAVLALQDFLAQSHIDDMQQQVDSAGKLIDVQKKANDARAVAQRDAENARYTMQQEAFDRQLELLRRYLAKHPEEWAKTNSRIMKLLASYGISYQTAGSSLGAYFVAGLREQIAAAVAAVKKMADLIPGMGGLLAGMGQAYMPSGYGYGNTGTVPGSTISYGGHGPIPLAEGSWAILKDNLLATLHKDELVAPADAAGLIRQLGSRKVTDGGFRRMSPTSGSGSGGTIIFQVGEEVLAEATDRNLQIQSDVYRQRRRTTVRSGR